MQSLKEYAPKTMEALGTEQKSLLIVGLREIFVIGRNVQITHPLQSFVINWGFQ